MTTTLYQLTLDSREIDGEFAAAMALLESEDPTELEQAEQLIASALERAGDNKQALAAKADSICHIIEMMHGRAQYLRQVAAQRIERAKAEERSAERLLQYLTRCMSAVNPGQKKFELLEHVLTSRPSEAVEIDDPAEVPAEFRRNNIVVKVPAANHAMVDELVMLLANHLSKKTDHAISIDTSGEPDKTVIKQAIKERTSRVQTDAKADGTANQASLTAAVRLIEEQSIPGARLVKRINWSLK